MTEPRGMQTAGAIAKAVDVLFHLHGSGAPQGVSAVGRALDLPKSSAHRLLQELGRRGLVERDERGLYRPGIALVALGLGALEREPAVVAARSVLEAEAHRLGETFFLVAARAGRLIVLDKAEGTGFLRAAPRTGQGVPAHATAVGKLFLAFDPDSLKSEGRPERFTEHTRVAARDLAREVERVRERGFAENREEWIPGLHALAAPVRVGGRLLASVAVAAPAARMRALGAEKVARRLLGAAERISARLAGRSEPVGRVRS